MIRGIAKPYAARVRDGSNTITTAAFSSNHVQSNIHSLVRKLFVIFFVPKIWEFAASSILVSGCRHCIIMIANSTKQIQCKFRNAQIFGQSYIFWEIATLALFFD